jgi:hypothetical protein
VDLEELAGGEVANEAAICSEEVVLRQVFESDPLDLVKDLVLDLAFESMDGVELEVYGAAVTVVVADAGDAYPDGGGDTQFLVKLTAKRLFRTLAGLNLAAGKLPLESHRLVRPPLANEHLAIADQEPRRDKSECRPGRARIRAWLRVFHATSLTGREHSSDSWVDVSFRT